MRTKQLIDAAIQEQGSPIDPCLLARMESSFETSIRDVRLHFSSASLAANEALGSLAFTIENHICFAREPDSFSGKEFSSLLAHELTHVAQKRKGRHGCGSTQRDSSEALLEQEACATSVAVLQGLPVTALSPDPSPSPRLFGPAGHYYTTFYLSLAVGFDYDMAAQIAFFTQLADQVAELDAVVAGFCWWGEYGESVFAGVPEFFVKLFGKPNLETRRGRFRQSVLDVLHEDQDWWINQMVRAWTVQAGLHALTGGDAHAETDKRLRILSRLEAGTLGFGLGIHALGDSYAHRDLHHGSKMYGPPLGHSVEAINEWARGVRHGDSHHPDMIHERPDIYSWYVEDLYGALRKKCTFRDPIPLKDLQADLKDVSDCKTEDEQIAAILEKAALLAFVRDTDLSKPRKSSESFSDKYQHLYHPEKDRTYTSMDFPPLAESYRIDHTKFLSADFVVRALAFGTEWVGGADPFHVSLEWDEIEHALGYPSVQPPGGASVPPLGGPPAHGIHIVGWPGQ